MIHKLIAIIVFSLISFTILGQNSITGTVKSNTNRLVKGVQIYNAKGGLVATTNSIGDFSLKTNKKQVSLVFFATQYSIKEIVLKANTKKTIIILEELTEQLNEIVINQRRRKIFKLKQLKDVQGTAIYAGKKTEVVLMEELVGNKAANSARQIYSQVVGLNIYENDDAGLQLNVGGRGLDPNRTSNFNTRQNGYDISADVLGYPESYYTPPADALEEIQVIRGAASLQYGTQFGGLLNFKFKKPIKNKSFELVARQSIGSNGLFNTFNSVNGTIDKTGYYGYVNYKKGNGFRPNSEFNSMNIHAHLEHKFTKKTSMIVEASYLDYLAKQAGGLTDLQFKETPLLSNRSRNWFAVNWNLWAVKLKHDFNEDSKFSFNVFGLYASRKAVGYRVSPIWLEDEIEDDQYVYDRDLIVGNYQNWGAEARFLSNYILGMQKQTYLVGLKYYNANNSEKQGPGSKNIDADFSFKSKSYGSDFKFPNKNLAFFGENMFNVTDNFSITPGFRLEYIKTESRGDYTIVLRDGAGNPLPGGILNYDDNRIKERSFALYGVGLSYKLSSSIEFYGNASKNYRSVTFNDIRTVSPTFVVDENIDDERGATIDLGVRGRYKNYVSYDLSGFSIIYQDRIGVYWVEKGPDAGDRLRTNIGDAFIYGFEGFTDFNFAEILNFNNSKVSLNYFVNTALTNSEYTKTKEKSVLGKEVEFIPKLNLKTGLKFGYENFLSSVQYTHLSKQYSDASHSSVDKTHPSYGTIGDIPAYSILDVSFSYTYKKWKLETGVNNALNESYFTRRATGYPGPGIIPSSPRSWYATLEFKL